jgi:hypothetical protein
MQNAAASLENGLEGSYKCKHNLNIQSSKSTPWYLPKGFENLFSCSMGNELWYAQKMGYYLAPKRKM